MSKNLIGSLKIAICDDITSDAKEIEMYLKKLFSLPQFKGVEYNIKRYASGECLLSSEAFYDLLFLDVEMPLGIDGFETARNFNMKAKKPLIIFITTHDLRAAEAFPVGGFRYLSKNFDEQKFLEALTTAISEINSNWQIVVHYKDEYGEELKSKLLYLNDITHIVADDKESVFYTKTKTFPSDKPLKHWESALPKNRFYKAHRSYIINFENVIDIDLKKRTVYLDCEVVGNNKINIPKGKTKEAFEAMHLFFRARRD